MERQMRGNTELYKGFKEKTGFSCVSFRSISFSEIRIQSAKYLVSFLASPFSQKKNTFSFRVWGSLFSWHFYSLVAWAGRGKENKPRIKNWFPGEDKNEFWLELKCSRHSTIFWFLGLNFPRNLLCCCWAVSGNKRDSNPVFMYCKLFLLKRNINCLLFT